MVTIRELFSAELPNFPGDAAALQKDSRIAQLAEAYAYDGRHFALANARHGGGGSTSANRRGAKAPHLGPSLDVALPLEEIEARCEAAKTAREEAHERIRIALMQRRGFRNRGELAGLAEAGGQSQVEAWVAAKQPHHLQQSQAFSMEETLDLDVPLPPMDFSSVCSKPPRSRSSTPGISPKQRQMQLQMNSLTEQQRAATPSTAASTRANTRQGLTPRPGSRASPLGSSRPASCTPILAGEEFVPAVFPFPEPIPMGAPPRPPPRKVPPWSRLSAGEPAPLDDPAAAKRQAGVSDGHLDSASDSEGTLKQEPTSPPAIDSSPLAPGSTCSKLDPARSASPCSRGTPSCHSARRAENQSVFLRRDSGISQPDSVRRRSSLTEESEIERRIARRDPLDDSSSNATVRQLQDAHDNRARANRWISECAPKRWVLEQEKPPWLQKTRRERAERRDRDKLLGKMQHRPFEVWLAQQRESCSGGAFGQTTTPLSAGRRSSSIAAEQDNEDVGEAQADRSSVDQNTLHSLRDYFQQVKATNKSPRDVERRTTSTFKRNFTGVDA